MTSVVSSLQHNLSSPDQQPCLMPQVYTHPKILYN